MQRSTDSTALTTTQSSGLELSTNWILTMRWVRRLCTLTASTYSTPAVCTTSTVCTRLPVLSVLDCLYCLYYLYLYCLYSTACTVCIISTYTVCTRLPVLPVLDCLYCYYPTVTLVGYWSPQQSSAYRWCLQRCCVGLYHSNSVCLRLIVNVENLLLAVKASLNTSLNIPMNEEENSDWPHDMIGSAH